MRPRYAVQMTRLLCVLCVTTCLIGCSPVVSPIASPVASEQQLAQMSALRAAQMEDIRNLGELYRVLQAHENDPEYAKAVAADAMQALCSSLRLQDLQFDVLNIPPETIGPERRAMRLEDIPIDEQSTPARMTTFYLSSQPHNTDSVCNAAQELADAIP